MTVLLTLIKIRELNNKHMDRFPLLHAYQSLTNIRYIINIDQCLFYGYKKWSWDDTIIFSPSYPLQLRIPIAWGSYVECFICCFSNRNNSNWINIGREHLFFFFGFFYHSFIFCVSSSIDMSTLNENDVGHITIYNRIVNKNKKIMVENRNTQSPVTYRIIA